MATEKRWGREFTPRDDGLHPSDAPGWWEWWYFDADFENGYTMAGTFHFGSPRPPGHRDARFIEIAIYDPEGDKRSVRKRYPKEQCSALEETCKVVIGPNIFEGEIPKYHLYFSEGEQGCDLTYENMVEGYFPTIPIDVFGEAHVGWANSAARAKITGTITWDNKTIEVKGNGYHDHNWSDIPQSEAAGTGNGFFGRLCYGDWTFVWGAGQKLRRFNHHSTMLMMAYKKDKLVAFAQNGNLAMADYSISNLGIDYPQSVMLRWDEPGLVEGELSFKVKQVIEAMDLVSRLKPFQRWYANTFVGRPAYYRYRFDYDLDLTIVGERVTGKGSSWCEHHKLV